MEKDKFVICRSFFCPVCSELNRPLDEYQFVVYGHENQCFFINKARYHGVKGITPHIIMYDGKHDDTHKEILVVCGIIGCGVKIYQTDNTEYPFDIELKKVRLYQIPNKDVEALLTFKDSLYKLD